MHYTQVKNPKWVDEEHSSIECEVNFEDISFEEFTPFGANPTDSEEHGRAIFADLVAGKYGVIAEYVKPAIPTAADQPVVDGAITL